MYEIAVGNVSRDVMRLEVAFWTQSKEREFNQNDLSTTHRSLKDVDAASLRGRLNVRRFLAYISMSVVKSSCDSRGEAPFKGNTIIW